MGQRTGRYIIHTDIGNGLYVLLGDVTGALSLGTAVDKCNGFCHLLMSHIIQHDNIGTGRSGQHLLR